MMKRKQPDSQPATEALAALSARLGEIRRQCNADQAELARLEKTGVFSPSQSDARKIALAARELLNGAAASLLQPLANDATEQIQALRHNILVATAALEEGERLAARLQRDAAQERFTANADEIRKVFEDITDAVVALEHAQQRRDALLKQIKLPADMVPNGWPLLGRLGRSESSAYRMLQALATSGWFPIDKFQAEVERSRRAMS